MRMPTLAILMLTCSATLSLGQENSIKTPAKTKVAKQAASKVFSRQFRKSAMIAQQARSKYADSARNMDDKRRTDAYKDEAERASVVARADAENLADKKGLLCLTRYETLVVDSQIARDKIVLWKLKTMGERPVPNSMILEEAARYKEQEVAEKALQDMLDDGEVRDCAWGEKTGAVATAAQFAILRSGFRIRHEHRLVMGNTTRLYLADDDSSFTDVPTEEIIGYEPEKHP